MRAMRNLGHKVTPIAFHRHTGPSQVQDRRLAASTWFIEDLRFADAIQGLLGGRLSVGRALTFALKQNGMSARSLLYSAAKVASVLRYEGCQHVHAHFAQATTATAIVAARMLGLTVSFVGHGFDVYATPADLPLKLESADFAVAVCKDMQNDFRSLAPEASVGLVYCGVEPERFQPRSLPSGRSGRLLFIGRLCATKGVDDLLIALSLLPEQQRPQVDLVGTGPLQDDLERQAKNLGVAPWIRFLGNRSSEWIAEHGPSYRALVGPFKCAPNGDRDTGPVVVKEAMSMGLPVLTTAFMGCKEMVAEATGIKVPPGDPQRLAEGLERIMSMGEDVLTTMGDAGRSRLANLFSARRQALALSSLVETA